MNRVEVGSNRKMDATIESAMRLAIEEARQSLREGNHGFGAVILKDGMVIAQAHDTEESEGDPTAHAEINVIRKAASLVGKSLASCTLLSTHEPCPMCASAIVWAGIAQIGYGYSISEALSQGRRRINLAAEEMFKKAGAVIQVEKGLLQEECGILYHAAVRAEVKRLRGASEERLRQYNEESARRRLDWVQKERPALLQEDGSILEKGYRLLLKRLKIYETEAPIVERTDEKIVFHSQNFCPTLEACKILQRDTRQVCRIYNEESTDRLLKHLDRRLYFGRNYSKIRPQGPYCEEWIKLCRDCEPFGDIGNTLFLRHR